MTNVTALITKLEMIPENERAYCNACHYRSEYEHFHLEYRMIYRGGKKQKERVKISDGFFADVNQLCLPCQVSRSRRSLTVE